VIRRIRIAVLLYVLLFVAAAQYLSLARSTDWDAPLWVDIYPVNGDGSPRTQAFIDSLDPADFQDLEKFFAQQARLHGLGIDRPFRLGVAPQPRPGPPGLPAHPSAFDVLLWSLRMRWYGARLAWSDDRPSPDIQLFAVYTDDASGAALDSMALRKGLMAVANVFADPAARGRNQFVMAHELLHTVGASDKYAPDTDLPRFPDGYAAPGARPRYPQRRAEIMGGRIPLDPTHARMPASLAQAVIGPATAAEIHWPIPPTAAEDPSPPASRIMGSANRGYAIAWGTD
jgi:hypothetical protein